MADGRFAAAWQETTADLSYPIMLQRFSADGTPAGTTPLTLGAGFAYDIAMDAAGDMVVARELLSPTTAEIHVQRYDSTGQPLGPDLLAGTIPTASIYSGQPVVAMDADGDFVVAWSDEERTIVLPTRYPLYLQTESVYARVYSRDGTPKGATERVHRTSFLIWYGSQQETISRPSISMDASGNFVVAWDWNGGYFRRYWSSGWPRGPKQSIPPTVGADTGGGAGVVAMAPNGSFDLAFECYVPSPVSLSPLRIDVCAAGYLPNGSAAAAPAVVNDVAEGILPMLAVNSAGVGIVAWSPRNVEDCAATSCALRARALNADGTPAGNDVALYPDDDGASLIGGIAMADDGSFVVLRSSRAPWVTGYSFSVQRFAGP
jgi:hypothetical protein